VSQVINIQLATSPTPILVNGIPGGASSGTVVSSGPYQATPLGYHQFTNLSTVINLQAVIPSLATYAIISVENSDIRWRDDGNNPTASVGFPFLSGQTMLFAGNLSALKFIQQTTGAVLNVSFYK